MIRADALWLFAQPVDMRAGAERLLSTVVTALGEACAHRGYLFAKARATHVKLAVHDGFGVSCDARPVHAGRDVWTSPSGESALSPPASSSTRSSSAFPGCGCPTCVITRI